MEESCVASTVPYPRLTARVAAADREGIKYTDGRTWNAILLNLFGYDSVERVGEGVWKLKAD